MRLNLIRSKKRHKKLSKNHKKSSKIRKTSMFIDDHKWSSLSSKLLSTKWRKHLKKWCLSRKSISKNLKFSIDLPSFLKLNLSILLQSQKKLKQLSLRRKSHKWYQRNLIRSFQWSKSLRKSKRVFLLSQGHLFFLRKLTRLFLWLRNPRSLPRKSTPLFHWSRSSMSLLLWFPKFITHTAISSTLLMMMTIWRHRSNPN